MSLMLLDVVLHLDAHLIALVHEYGALVYAILFAIIFCETGLVIAPFLPGDSLLFVGGALCGSGLLDVYWLMPLLMLAAFSGDNSNYWIGRLLGLRIVQRAGLKLIRHEHMEKTRVFYEKHGGKTILFGRFLPIVRTFAPFVAGVGLMRYRLFVIFSALGSLAWISFFMLAGYFFGNLPWVKNNLTLMVLGIVVISLMPAMRAYWRRHRPKTGS